jgi:predicted ArsR family transcriptional regulator
MNDMAKTEPARTKDRILNLLLSSEEPLTVQALSRALGISRNAANQHVMAMEREGLIDRAFAIRTKGRPSQGYRLSAAGRSQFPRQYSLLARQLLGELSRHLGPDELGGEADRSIPVIASLMRELGYESRALASGGELEIEAHNCVFHDLAMADPAICEVDLALLRSLSGQAVEHRTCMARGQHSCRFAFRPDKPTA